MELSKGGRPKKGEKVLQTKQVWFRMPQEVYDLIPNPKSLTLRVWVLEKLCELKDQGKI